MFVSCIVCVKSYHSQTDVLNAGAEY